MAASRLVQLGLTLIVLLSSAAHAATLYVAKGGADSGNSCTNQASPCATIGRGIGAMKGGDTLIVGDGTYTEAVSGMPSGSSSAYTTIRAANDWGVTIDGSGFSNNYNAGIEIQSKHYVLVRGFHVKMNQARLTNEPIAVLESDHVKLQRCSASYGPTDDNAASIDIGPMSSYVTIEECYAFGGSRYQFLVYQSHHVIVRRSVARHDHWTGDLQCAGFVNYDSVSTAWQNNIVLDSDTANCPRNLYGGFFNENKTDFADDTSQTLQGNIILNVKAFYAGDLDWLVSGTRSIEDMVIWGGTAGYHGDGGNGIAAHININHMTAGGATGTYDGPNEGAAQGTGVSIYGNVDNTVTNSIFLNNRSLGIADYTKGDYNAYWGNGSNYGGAHKATAGAHDRTDDVVTASLRYLPRVEAGSPLKTAGAGGGQIGAEIMVKIGATGTLHGEPGWNTPTTESLWPFPNEDQIKADMAAYGGPGAKGARGFATGNSLDGTPQTLTKYVWEALGNKIPAEIYGFRIAADVLPGAVVGQPYSTQVSVSGGTQPYTWAVTGDLPPGLMLDPASGAITGTPTEAGATTFTVTVADSGAQSSEKSLTIVVESNSTTGSGGSNSTTGSGGSGIPETAQGGGCGCRAAEGRVGGAAALFALALTLARRRRRRA